MPLKPRKISVGEARVYYAHDTQQKASMVTPEQLPEDGFQYWACGGVCGAFHRVPWPGVWMAHYAVEPTFWGRATDPSRAILQAFWDAEQPNLIVGWTKSTNRAALSFSRRIGFTETGRMELPGETVIEQSWRP